MRIDLTGHELRRIGSPTPVSEAAEAALRANGAVTTGAPPSLLLVSLPLLPSARVDVGPTLADAEAAAAAMAAGRVIFLLPAAAGLPMRRHPAFSAAMASALATMRTLAMRRAPRRVW